MQTAILFYHLCLYVCLSCCGTVAKQMPISSNFFNHLVVFQPYCHYKIPRGTSTALNVQGYENLCEFQPILSFISEAVQDRPVVTMDHY